MDGYAAIWEYEVRPGAQEEFVRHYGPEGTWAALFRRAEGYRGTDLLQDPSRPSAFLTIDRWESEEAWNRFRARFAAEYAALDAACERLTASETPRGGWRAWRP